MPRWTLAIPRAGDDSSCVSATTSARRAAWSAPAPSLAVDEVQIEPRPASCQAETGVGEHHRLRERVDPARHRLDLAVAPDRSPVSRDQLPCIREVAGG